MSNPVHPGDYKAMLRSLNEPGASIMDRLSSLGSLRLALEGGLAHTPSTTESVQLVTCLLAIAGTAMSPADLRARRGALISGSWQQVDCRFGRFDEASLDDRRCGEAYLRSQAAIVVDVLSSEKIVNLPVVSAIEDAIPSLLERAEAIVLDDDVLSRASAPWSGRQEKFGVTLGLWLRALVRLLPRQSMDQVRQPLLARHMPRAAALLARIVRVTLAQNPPLIWRDLVTFAISMALCGRPGIAAIQRADAIRCLLRTKSEDDDEHAVAFLDMLGTCVANAATSAPSCTALHDIMTQEDTEPWNDNDVRAELCRAIKALDLRALGTRAAVGAYAARAMPNGTPRFGGAFYMPFVVSWHPDLWRHCAVMAKVIVFGLSDATRDPSLRVMHSSYMAHVLCTSRMVNAHVLDEPLAGTSTMVEALLEAGLVKDVLAAHVHRFQESTRRPSTSTRNATTPGADEDLHMLAFLAGLVIETYPCRFFKALCEAVPSARGGDMDAALRRAGPKGEFVLEWLTEARLATSTKATTTVCATCGISNQGLAGRAACMLSDASARAGVKLRSCQRCKGAYYCGQACQRAHWRGGHKAECHEKDAR
jgi:hypothetical protein